MTVVLVTAIPTDLQVSNTVAQQPELDALNDSNAPSLIKTPNIDVTAGSSDNVDDTNSITGITTVSQPLTAGADTSTASTCLATDVANQGSHTNAWFASWATSFMGMSEDLAWRALVSEWAQFEVLTPPGGVHLYCFSFFLSFHLCWAIIVVSMT